MLELPRILIECGKCHREQVWLRSIDQYCISCSERMGAWSIAVHLNEESQRRLTEKKSLQLLEQSREETVAA
jgi:hypothetical protein